MLALTQEQREINEQHRREQLENWLTREANGQNDIKRGPVVKNPKPENRDKHPRFASGAMLLDAAASGQHDELERLLKAGANPNYQDMVGNGPLHKACVNNDPRAIELLMAAGADIELQDASGWTPLFTAIHFGSSAALQTLFKYEPNLLALDKNNNLPCDICGLADMIVLLKDAYDEHDITVGHIQDARAYEEKALIKEINKCIKEKRPVSTIPIVGNASLEYASPLHVAACKGYISVARLCINNGVNINERDSHGWTAMHAAAFWNQIPMAKYLIRKGALLEEVTFRGESPFDLASTDEMETLIENAIKERTKKYGSELGRTSSESTVALEQMPAPAAPTTLSRMRLKPHELAHLDKVHERETAERKKDQMIMEQQPKRKFSYYASSSKRAIVLQRVCVAFSCLLFLAGGAAGGALLGLTGLCVGDTCGTPSSEPCSAQADCATCSGQTGCVWCARWQGEIAEVLGEASCTTGLPNSLLGNYCLPNGGPCGKCAEYYFTQCKLPNNILYPVLIACMALMGVTFLILITACLRKLICPPSPETQFFGASEDLWSDSASNDFVEMGMVPMSTYAADFPTTAPPSAPPSGSLYPLPRQSTEAWRRSLTRESTV